VWRSAEDELRRARQRSWAAFLGSIGLVVGAVLASMTRVVPDLVTTLAGMAGVAAIIYGVSTGVLVVLNREPDEERAWNREGPIPGAPSGCQLAQAQVQGQCY
jgi:hypothetical protein